MSADKFSRKKISETDRLGVLSSPSFEKEVDSLLSYFSARDRSVLIDEIIKRNMENEEEQREFFEFFEEDYPEYRPHRGESNKLTQFYLEKGMKRKIRKSYNEIPIMSEVIRALVTFYWRKIVAPKDEKIKEIMKIVQKTGLNPEKVVVLPDHYSILIRKEE